MHFPQTRPTSSPKLPKLLCSMLVWEAMGREQHLGEGWGQGWDRRVVIVQAQAEPRSAACMSATGTCSSSRGVQEADCSSTLGPGPVLSPTHDPRVSIETS